MTEPSRGARDATEPHEPLTAVVGRAADGEDWLIRLGPAADAPAERVAAVALSARVAAIEHEHAPRWVVASLRAFYPALLAAGVRLRRAHDLLLCHAVLRDTPALTRPLAPSALWVREEAVADAAQPGLFEFAALSVERRDDFDAVAAQWHEQRLALASAADARLALLCAAESTGALIAEEMTAAGLPYSGEVHRRILVESLGPRPAAGARPARMAQLAQRIGALLEDETVNPDSPPRLLRALHRRGILVDSTSRSELARVEHPVVAPLLEYKRLARLFAANGWTWLDTWVRGDRFRPVYLAGGVVTGRWAAAGGGALQIPRQLRAAVRADAGWTLVAADAAQLEPRVLAALSRDEAMADAARGSDLYEGVVRSGAVGTRTEAKYAVLGAMYGATKGESGRLVPRLRAVYPRAMGLVDAAARTGERGGVVSTLLGRGSPAPEDDWRRWQALAGASEADAGTQARARSRVRDRGRFTRNFVVQGTAAEWALLWLAEIRHRLSALPPASAPAAASGALFSSRAHLAFFLHDEVIVHCPFEQADAVAAVIRTAADAATARLFPGFPIEVPLTLRVGPDAGADAGQEVDTEADADAGA